MDYLMTGRLLLHSLIINHPSAARALRIGSGTFDLIQIYYYSNIVFAAVIFNNFQS